MKINLVGNEDDSDHLVDSNPAMLKAKRILQSILLELCIRKDNYYVGSELGGNVFEYFNIYNMEHFVEDPTIFSCKDIYIDEYHEDVGALFYNSEWLLKTNRVEIRKTLSSKIAKLSKYRKQSALLMCAAVDSPSIRKCIIENKEHFKDLYQNLACSPEEVVAHLSFNEQVIMAMMYCQELAIALDNNNYTLLPSVGKTLSHLPVELQLLSIRVFITLHRIIIHNLDEAPIWKDIFNNINSYFD